MDTKVTPTDDVDYTCHIKPYTTYSTNYSYGIYITPHHTTSY